MKKIILTIFLSIVAATLFAQSDDFLENATVTFRRHNCQERLHSKLDSRAVSDSTYRLMPHVGNPRVLVILAEFSDKTFSVNQPVLYVITCAVIGLVIFQSVFFLRRYSIYVRGRGKVAAFFLLDEFPGKWLQGKGKRGIIFLSI